MGCAEELRELRKREKEQGISSNWEIDSFMAADTLEGKREAIVTEYMLRILGLDVSRHAKICICLLDVQPISGRLCSAVCMVMPWWLRPALAYWQFLACGESCSHL